MRAIQLSELLDMDAVSLARTIKAKQVSCRTKGIPTTQGSPLLRDFIPQTDAFVVERMKKCGAIITAKPWK